MSFILAVLLVKVHYVDSFALNGLGSSDTSYVVIDYKLISKFVYTWKIFIVAFANVIQYLPYSI